MTSLNNKKTLAHEVVEDSNPTDNIDFQTIINRRMNRRSILKGGTGLTAAAFFGALPLVGCSDDDDSNLPVKPSDDTLVYLLFYRIIHNFISSRLLVIFHSEASHAENRRHL